MNEALTNRALSLMSEIEIIESRIAHDYSEGRMRCPTHLSLGQEASAVAFGLLVQREDFCVGAHRGHAHYIAKGGNVRRMIAELHGRGSGCSGGRGGSMHLVDTDVNFMGTTAILGNSIPLAVGLGMALKRKGAHATLSTAVFGDGATEEGVFYESMNLAAVLKLPVLFICEDNGLSVYTGRDARHPKNRSLCGISRGMGIQAFLGADCSFESTYEALSEGFRFVREKQLPALVHLQVHRTVEHCGPNNDDNLGYRSDEELAHLAECDPFLRLRAAARTGIEGFDRNYENQRRAFESDLDEVIADVLAEMPPKVETRGEHLFADH